MSRIDLLYRPVHPLRLAVFRIVFGFFALLESLYFYKTYLIQDYIIGPKHLFNYHFLPLQPLPETIMQVLLFICLLCSFGILIGKFYRASSIGFFSIYSYFFLLDKSYYNNHLYLIALLAFLLIFIPANQALSLDKKKGKPAYSWHLWVLRLQLCLVYFFGGLAKINSDWLFRQEPARIFLESTGKDIEFLLPVIVWGGMLFDLLIGFFLILPKTRKLAIVGVIVFNIGNHLLFDDINIFPFFMMASLVLFLKPEEWGFLKKYAIFKEPANKKTKSKKTVVALLSIYFIVQFSLPLRHYLIDSNPDWTSEGQRFAWRMKIQSRDLVNMEFRIYDLDKKVIYPVSMNQHLNEYQVGQMMYYPYMMLDFAHYLGDYARKNGVPHPAIKADIRVKFNARPAQAVFSPEIDLLEVEWDAFSANKWINPLNN